MKFCPHLSQRDTGNQPATKRLENHPKRICVPPPSNLFVGVEVTRLISNAFFNFSIRDSSRHLLQCFNAVGAAYSGYAAPDGACFTFLVVSTNMPVLRTSRLSRHQKFLTLCGTRCAQWSFRKNDAALWKGIQSGLGLVESYCIKSCGDVTCACISWTMARTRVSAASCVSPRNADFNSTRTDAIGTPFRSHNGIVTANAPFSRPK